MKPPRDLPPDMQVLMTTIVGEAAALAQKAAIDHIRASIPDRHYQEALTCAALCEAYVTHFGPRMGGGDLGAIAAESGHMIAMGLLEEAAAAKHNRGRA